MIISEQQALLEFLVCGSGRITDDDTKSDGINVVLEDELSMLEDVEHVDELEELGVLNSFCLFAILSNLSNLAVDENGLFESFAVMY